MTLTVQLLFFVDSFEAKYNYSCPEDCEKSRYDARLSSALFMPGKLIPIKKYEYLLNTPNMPNETEGAVDFIL